MEGKRRERVDLALQPHALDRTEGRQVRKAGQRGEVEFDAVIADVDGGEGVSMVLEVVKEELACSGRL